MATNPKIPQVLMLRDRESGEEATQEWAITEAKYVINMISDGGSNYADDPDGGKAALRACNQYLKLCGA